MKYTMMGYYQERAVALGLDLADLAIISWIKGLIVRRGAKTITIDGKVYLWVCYDALLDDLPILGMTKVTLRRRLRALEEKGVLIHHTSRKGGVFSYYGFGGNAEGLEYTSTLTTKKANDTTKMSQPLTTKMSQQRTTYIENKTIDNIKESIKFPTMSDLRKKYGQS